MPRRTLTVLLAFLMVVTLGLVWLIFINIGRTPVSSPLPNPNGYDDFILAGSAVTGDVSTSDPDELRALVSTNAEALRLVRLGLTRKSSVFTLAAITNYAGAMDDLPKFKTLSLLLEANGRLAELEHRPAEAAASYFDAIHLGNEMRRGGFLIHHLVGVACQGIGSRSLAKLLPTLSCEEARPLTPKLQNLDASAVSWDEVSRNEHAFFRYELRKSFNPYKIVIAWLQCRQIMKTGEIRHNMALAHVRLLALEASLRCYLSVHGHAPTLLQELVPEYLDRVPGDPFSGRPLVYINQGAKWQLYSVGPDGIDDRGKPIGRGIQSEGDLFYDSPW